MPTSKASAKWAGGLRSGNGEYSAGTGTFSGKYTFATRFEGTKGTNPEELIAAAHAACFSMALAGALEKGGHAPTHIATTAACTVEKVGEGFTITKMRLETRGHVPGIDAAGFQVVYSTNEWYMHYGQPVWPCERSGRWQHYLLL